MSVCWQVTEIQRPPSVGWVANYGRIFVGIIESLENHRHDKYLYPHCRYEKAGHPIPRCRKGRFTLSTTSLKDAMNALIAERSEKPVTAAPSCALGRSTCHCGGIGYKIGAELGFAKAILCTCVESCAACLGSARMIVDGHSKPCKEPSPKRLVNLFNEAGIPAKYANARYEGFRNFSGNGHNVHRKIGQWLTSAGDQMPRGLLIGGPVGVGKTYMLAAMARYLIGRGLSVRFIDFFQLLGQLKAAYSKDQSDESILAPLMNVDVLFVDELGKGRNSDWELTILDNLVMGRYNANKIIVGSTNYQLQDAPNKSPSYQFETDAGTSRQGFSPDQFESLELRVGARIYSRLIEMCDFVSLSGDDYRRSLANPQHAAPSSRKS